jgi:O-acetyl-ADP-ribose deacetylase (regulator of RNase III)
MDGSAMLVSRTGDLFSSTCPALAHGVNTLGRMGAGIAVEFRRRWPAMYDAYVAECRSGRLRPGGIFVYQAPDRLIVNMATQQRVGRGSARLEWVRSAARQVARLPLEGLALPRIGAGLGGLAWDDVAAVLEAELASLPYVEGWSLPDAR